SLDLEPDVQQQSQTTHTQQRQTSRTQQTQTARSQQNQASSGQQSQKTQTLQETQTSTAATNPVNTGFQPSYVDGQNQSPVTKQNTSSNASQSSHIAAHKTQPTAATTTRQENNSTENNSAENNSAENNSAENNSVENNSVENNSVENNSTENNSTEEPVEDIFNPSFSDIAESDRIDSDEAFFMTEPEPENPGLSSATRLAQGARAVSEEKAQKIGTTPTGTRLPENTVTVKESTSSVQTTTPVQTTTTTPVQTTTTTPVQTTTTTTTPVQTAITTTTSSASSSPAKTTSTTTASSTQTQTDVEETPTYSTTITPEIPTVTNTPPVQSFTPSRTVTLRTKEYLECTYPGTGWVYLGETVQTPLMDYRGRNISTGDTLFTLQAKQEGTTYLHFYKYDALADTFIDDYLEVIVKGSGSSDNRVRAPQYELIVPERLGAESQHAASSTLTENDTLENANANARTSSANTNASGKTSTTTSSAASTAPSTSDNAGESSVSTVIQTTESSSASDTARNTSRTSSATPLTNTTESNNADTTNLSADDLLALAQKAYDAKEYEDALMYLNDFFEKSATRLDEGLYLKGQTLEAPSSVRNIRSALETYETLVAQYPESKLWEKANQRITYLKRFYFNIR
ncbi:MAG TPA: hypothetical protein DCQ43_01170, partial [Treponema sp.]|nr:hypothetical protein [Treponema sp.]